MRADRLPGLSKAGREALVDYGVSLVVDMRPEREDAEDVYEPLPVPVERTPVDPAAVPAAWTFDSMHEAYLGMIRHFPDEFARALTLLGQAEPPVAVHCAGGRDRTGIACGMALWLAGAEPDAIAADHALSDESWAPHHAEWLAEAPDEEERESRRRITRPAGLTLAEVLEQVEQETGIRRLLVDAGADPAALDRLAQRLRTNP